MSDCMWPVPGEFFSNIRLSFSFVICMLLVLWQVCLSAFIIFFTRTFYPLCLFLHFWMQMPSADGKSWQLFVAVGWGFLAPLVTQFQHLEQLPSYLWVMHHVPSAKVALSILTSLQWSLTVALLSLSSLSSFHLDVKLFWEHTLGPTFSPIPLGYTLTPAFSHGTHLPLKSQVFTPQTP